MDDQKFKKTYLILIAISVLLTLFMYLYRYHKNKVRPVYVDGVRTEIFGVSDPEKANQIRYKLLNEMKYGEDGIPQDFNVQIQKSLQEQRLNN